MMTAWIFRGLRTLPCSSVLIPYGDLHFLLPPRSLPRGKWPPWFCATLTLPVHFAEFSPFTSQYTPLYGSPRISPCPAIPICGALPFQWIKPVLPIRTRPLSRSTHDGSLIWPTMEIYPQQTPFGHHCTFDLTTFSSGVDCTLVGATTQDALHHGHPCSPP